MRANQLDALVEATQRQIWEPSQSAPLEAFPDSQHGCIACGVAFETKQAWAAHAARVHHFRAKHTVLAKGTKCQACLRSFSSQHLLARHLQGLPKCLSHVAWLEQNGRLEALSDATGHVQAPPAPSEQEGPTLQAGTEGCLELLEALREQQPTAVEDVLSMIPAFIEPFDVLRQTLELAVVGNDIRLPEDTQRAVNHLLPLFRVDLLCSRGQALKRARDAVGFVPDIKPFPHDRCSHVGPVVCVGACADCEVAQATRMAVVQCLSFEELDGWKWPDAFDLSATVPVPPFLSGDRRLPLLSSCAAMCCGCSARAVCWPPFILQRRKAGRLSSAFSSSALPIWGCSGSVSRLQGRVWFLPPQASGLFHPEFICYRRVQPDSRPHGKKESP